MASRDRYRVLIRVDVETVEIEDVQRDLRRLGISIHRVLPPLGLIEARMTEALWPSVEATPGVLTIRKDLLSDSESPDGDDDGKPI